MPIDFASVANLNHQDDEPVIVNSADNPIVANPVSPAPAQRTSQAISYLPFIIKGHHAVFKIILDSPAVRRVKL
jgi:hypothetical protein